MATGKSAGNWYQFFDDDQPSGGTPPAGGMAAALLGSSSVSGTLTVTRRRRGGRGMSSSGMGGSRIRIDVVHCKEDKYGNVLQDAVGMVRQASTKVLEDACKPKGPHPESIPGTKKKVDHEVERMRERIKKYKAEIEKLQSAKSGRRAELEKENARLLEALRRAEVRLEAAVKAVESAAQVNLDLLVESTLKSLTPATAPAAPALPAKPGIPPVVKLALSAGVFLATHYGVPKEQETLRAMGYGMAIAIAASAIGG